MSTLASVGVKTLEKYAVDKKKTSGHFFNFVPHEEMIEPILIFKQLLLAQHVS